MTQLEKLKKLLGIELTDTTKDFPLQFILDDVFQIIKDYCHIKEVPIELGNTVLKMAIDLYRSENLGSEENSLGSISSITEGDTSISYKNTIDYKDGLIKNYKTQLNKYRKLVW